MSFNDGFSLKPIPFVPPLPGTSSMLVSTPDGTGWTAAGIVDNAISSSVYVIETIETVGNIAGNGAPEDPVLLKNNISLTSVTASFKGNGSQVTDITASNIPNFSQDVRLQLSGTQYIQYNNTNGVLIVPFTGSTIGTTPLVLGTTINSISGLNSVSSVAFSGNGANLTGINTSNISGFQDSVRAQLSAGDGISFVSGVITANVAEVVAGPNMVVENNGGVVTASLSSSVTGLDNLQTISGSIASLTSSDVFITANLRVNGTASIAQINTVNQTSLKVGDKFITILTGGVDHATLDGSGILWGSGGVGPTVDSNGANAHVTFNSTLDLLEIFPGVYSSGLITGSTAKFNSVTASFNGDGNQVTNVTASNITNFTNDVRAQLSAGQNINFTTGTISFTGTLPVLNGGTGLTSSGVSANILISNGAGYTSQPISQDVNITSTGVATVKGLYTNPVRNPTVTTPVPGDFLKWGGTDWFPAPVSATVGIGSLQLTADPPQTITANGQTVLPTSAYWRLLSAGNFNAGNINYVGAGLGQILFIQVPIGQAGSVTFNKGATLALGSNTRRISAGGSLQLIYDGARWIEMFFNTSTST